MQSVQQGQQSASAPGVAERIQTRIAFLVKVSRPGLWSTAVWFYLLTAARLPITTSGRFWLGAFYFAFPFGLLLYGWNDIGDRDTDRKNPRKGNYLFGARASDTDLGRLPLQIAAVQLPFVVAFALLVGVIPTLLWLAALVAANFLYNNRPFRFKGVPPLDLANQAGYLLVFVLGVWLNRAAPLPWQTYLFGYVFAMIAHLFGQIMDIGPDRAAGRRTTATQLGVRGSKALLIAFLLGEAAFVIVMFHNYLAGAGFLGAALCFVLDVTVLVRDRFYSPVTLRLFALGLNIGMVGSLYWVWATGSLSRLP